MRAELAARLTAWAVDRAGKLTSERAMVAVGLMGGLLYLASEAAEPWVQLGLAGLAVLVGLGFLWAKTVRPTRRSIDHTDSPMARGAARRRPPPLTPSPASRGGPMPKKIRALFQVGQVERHDNCVSVSLEVVTAESHPEHAEFWEATPSGEITMVITNPAAFDVFETGAVVPVDFEVSGPR